MSKNDPFGFVKENSSKPPEKSASLRFAVLENARRESDRSFKKSFWYVPVSLFSMVVLLFVGAVMLAPERAAMVESEVSQQDIDAFIEESFTSYYFYVEDSSQGLVL